MKIREMFIQKHSGQINQMFNVDTDWTFITFSRRLPAKDFNYEC